MRATETSEGAIPHHRVVVDGRELQLPVKLAIEPNSRGGMSVVIDNTGPSYRRLPHPMRRDGKLVYALPGGGELIA